MPANGWLRHRIAQRSFRLKLIALVLLAEVATLLVVFWQGRALLETQLREQVRQRIEQINPLLNAALALSLAQRDYAAVDDIARQAMTGQSLIYLAIESQGRQVVVIGTPPRSEQRRSLEEAMQSNIGTQVDIDLPLAIYGETLGTVSYGISLAFLDTARQRLETQVLQTGVAGALLALLLLGLLAHGLMRRLTRVEQVVGALATGDMSQRIAVQGDSEIDHLGLAFNHMADALEARIAEIDQLNADLESRVRERTTELAAARDEAERLARVKSEFLANMSHEIRTPLNGVLGMAQIGQRRSSDLQACQSFKRILYSGKLLLRVLNDILDFSKIEAGKLTIENEPLQLGEVLHQAIDLVRQPADDKGLAMTLTLASNLPERCRGDALRLGQVLLNLLGNAIKFTGHGGIALNASAEDGWLVLQVTDSGIGMEAAQLDRLFRPFEQAESSTTRRFGGTGLGLAISKQLVGLMGGTIGATSRPGIGSTFTVRLPLDTVATPLPALASPPVALPLPGRLRRLTGLRILAAEDEPVNQIVLEDNLIDEGASITLVGDGAAAVARIETDGIAAYDVVLMDVMMPVMDGCMATQRIKTLAPQLPVIGQTAHAQAEEHARCRAAGMIDLITKPIDIDEMVATILRHTRPATPHP